MRLFWQAEEYDLGPVQFWYTEHQGGSLVHHYRLSDIGGEYTFELSLETDNLTWNLDRATPATASTRLPQSGLVGAVV